MSRRQSSNNLRRSRGFTLIELLVVIAIVSLLVSILLPSLNRAKKLTKRVVCGSNLHGVNMAYALYASENKSCVPVGYCYVKQYNYMLAGGTWFGCFGYLYTADMMPEPKIFYCPTYPMFDVDWNPWPPEEGATTRSGYGCRPEVDWGSGEPDPFPRLFNLGSKALVADFASCSVQVDDRHGEGVEVGYTDGSVNWVDRGIFDEVLEELPPSYNSAANGTVDDLWEIFDNRR